MAKDSLSRPEKVRLAVILLYLTLGIGVVRVIIEAPPITEGVPFGFVMFFSSVVLAIVWFFIHMIGKAKNWARITLLVLFILGMPFFVLLLPQTWATNLFSGLLGIAQTVIQIVALIFLFQKPSSDWFKQMKRLKTTGE